MNENDIYAAQNMYDAWDNGDRPAIRQQFARRDELIRLAGEAGFMQHLGVIAIPNIQNLERFADLVAAAEREACARECEADGLLWGQRYAAAIRARENT